MTLIEIYNFIFNYEVKTSFSAFLRVITCGFLISFIGWIIKDAMLFSHPKKIFSGKDYMFFSNKIWPQISLFNIFPNSIIAQKIIFILFFLFGIFSILGFFTNISIFIFTILFISIQSRILPTFFSAGDTIARVLLISLIFLDCGSKYSIDYLMGISSNLEIVNGWSVRMVQFTVSMSYFLSSIFKIKDYYWADGEGVRNAVLSPFWGRNELFYFPWISFLFKNKIIYKTLSHFVIIFEFLAPLIFYINETRFLAIICGCLLHFGIIIFMRIGFFGPIMLVALMFFTNQYFI